MGRRLQCVGSFPSPRVLTSEYLAPSHKSCRLIRRPKRTGSHERRPEAYMLTLHALIRQDYGSLEELL
jgi:hypothetical protein